MPRQLNLLTLITLLCLAVPHAQAQQNNTQQPDDAAITNEIVEEMLADEIVDGYTIEVETNDGIVTLDGVTTDLISKERAERMAEIVRGVRAVVNQIRVDTKQVSDTQLRNDVISALAYDEATEAYNINVSVDDQVVTLTGTVDSWHESELAGYVVKSVQGVEKLVNNLDVDYEIDRSDADIRADITQSLRWDTRVDDGLIDVSVTDGEVFLSGTVGSAAEKRRAIADAWVAGVNEVNAEQLEVEGWARDEQMRQDKYTDITDEDILQAINDALMYDPRVDDDHINVVVDDGVVTLSGQVDHVQARRSAIQTTRNTTGVWRVKDSLRVTMDDELSEEQIAQNVRNALLRDPLVNRYEISVTVIDHTAYLTGSVDSYLEKVEAEDVASAAQGVTRVNNNLIVEDIAGDWYYEPFVDLYEPYTYDWFTYPDTGVAMKSDWEIMEDVNDELWWSPFVDSDDVNVTVDDGEVTLTGTVGTWNERQVATENAYEGGAILVDNNLNIDYGPDYYE